MMNFMRIFRFLLFFTATFADSGKKNKKTINCASKAIASLVDFLSDQYQMRFHIVSIYGDVTSKDIANKIISLYPSNIYLENIFNISVFTYTFGVSYVLITKRGILLELSKKRELPNLSFVNRTFTSYGSSLFLNYA